MNLAPQHIEAQPAPSGGRKVGDIWREGATWYEQAVSDTNKPWVLPIVEIEDQIFGMRVVCGCLELPHLAGDASTEQIRALEAEIRRAWHSELMAALECDRVELRRILDGGSC